MSYSSYIHTNGKHGTRNWWKVYNYELDKFKMPLSWIREKEHLEILSNWVYNDYVFRPSMWHV